MKTKLRDKIVKPSTRQFAREARRARNYSLTDFLHGYVYARWPYLYIGIGTGEHPLARSYSNLKKRINQIIPHNGSSPPVEVIEDKKPAIMGGPSGTFADGYHGKVVPLESARRLVTVGEEIELPDLEQVIPYPRARDIVMHNPDHLAVLDCPCRVSRENPCLPLDVCLIVGEPFSSFILEHHPERARQITQSEAVEILEAEQQRGHVHHAFFKDAMLGRFYAICNCCSCCCGAMQSQRNGTPMLASSGYIAVVDELLCQGCSDCNQYCQFGAITMAGPTASIDLELCMGCGVCVAACTNDALTLERDTTKGEPLEIIQLLERAAV